MSLISVDYKLISLLFGWFVLSIISILALRRQKLIGINLAIWAFMILALPYLGAAAFWLIKPTESQKTKSERVQHVPTRREIIRSLSRNFVIQSYPEEIEYFDTIWELLPDDLDNREIALSLETDARFWDELHQNPYVTDIVTNIVAAIIFELGIIVGRKLTGLVKNKLRKQEVATFLNDKYNQKELIDTVFVFVYEHFNETVKAKIALDDLLGDNQSEVMNVE